MTVEAIAHRAINDGKAKSPMKISRLAVALSATAIVLAGWTIPAWSAPGGQNQGGQLGARTPTCDNWIGRGDGVIGWTTTSPSPWSTHHIPTSTELACIPASFKGTVGLAATPPNYAIAGIKALNKGGADGGIEMENWGVELTDASYVSRITNLHGAGNAGITIGSDVSLDLEGTGNNLNESGGGAGDIDGPGTLVVPSGSKLTAGGQTGGALQVKNFGTIDAPHGYSSCDVTNESSGTINATGPAEWGTDSSCTGDTFTNDGTLDITGHSLDMSDYSTWQNNGTVNVPSTPSGQQYSLALNDHDATNDGTIATAGVVSYVDGTSVTFPTNSILTVSIPSTNPPSEFFTSTDGVVLGGALNIDTGSFTPGLGDTYDVVTDGTLVGSMPLSGSFSSVDLNNQGNLCIPADGPDAGFQVTEPTAYVLQVQVVSDAPGC
jgi:hypothetical protein